MLLSGTWCRMRQSLTNEGFLHARGEKKNLQLNALAVWFVPVTLCREAFLRALFRNFGVVTERIRRL